MEASPQLNPRYRPFTPSRLLQTQPDRVLCALALRGNAGAFEALYNRHHGPLYGFVYHLLGRGAAAEDAEDIAQEAFGTAFSKLGERRDDASFKSWLFTIARNRAYDQMRARCPAAADVTELPLVSETGTERDAEGKAHMAWLMGALAVLPERQREALVMREMGGLTYNEIATGMQTTVSGVKQLINRARGSLTEAAEGAEYRPRRLSKELGALVPALPLAGGAGLTAFGIGGSAAASAAGIGGVSAATKVAAVVLAAAAVGGGAASIHSVGGGHKSAIAGRSAVIAAATHRTGDAARVPASVRTAGEVKASSTHVVSVKRRTSHRKSGGAMRSAPRTRGSGGGGKSHVRSQDGSPNVAPPDKQASRHSGGDNNHGSSSGSQDNSSPADVQPPNGGNSGDLTNGMPHIEGGGSALQPPDGGGQGGGPGGD